jgi:DNA invertase Pin-like site-specific DNA recombinase
MMRHELGVRPKGARMRFPRFRPHADEPHPMAVLNQVTFGRPVPAPAFPPAPPPPPDPHALAAQYLRMSTEHQVYSTACQQEVIAKYARDFGLEIVRTYADEGKSGLDADGRPGLLAMLDEVTSGRADYRTILVFDVSRWGRFQDCDEAAYYEHVCRRSGIRVEYCGEPFRNDGTPMSMIIKALKRMMAGEYSRELSDKVFAAKCRITKQGFRVGGLAGYGLRRMLVDRAGNHCGVLQRGQQKHLQEYRVVLVPGPPEEVRTLKWIFEQIAKGRAPGMIAQELNRRGVSPPTGARWNSPRIRELLGNEKYIGNLVYNRTSVKLKRPLVRHPPEAWVRRDGAFPAIIDPALFKRAHETMASWTRRIDNDGALAKLRRLYVRHGYLSQRMIDGANGMPGAAFYDNRFGGLLRAYALVGYEPGRDYRYMSQYSARCKQAVQVRAEIAEALRARGLLVNLSPRGAVLNADGVRISVLLALRQELGKKIAWTAQVHLSPAPVWVLIARPMSNAGGVQDYWLTQGGPHLFRLGSRLRKGRTWKHAADAGPLLDVIATTAQRGRPPG